MVGLPEIDLFASPFLIIHENQILYSLGADAFLQQWIPKCLDAFHRCRKGPGHISIAVTKVVFLRLTSVSEKHQGSLLKNTKGEKPWGSQKRYN